jgi:hypothetical protein
MPSVAYKMAKENRRELFPIFSPQFNKNYQAFKALLSIYHNTNVFCLKSNVLCLVSSVLCLKSHIPYLTSHISYLISHISNLPPSTLLRLSFGPPSDLVRSCFGKHPNKVRTRSESKRTESGTRVKKNRHFSMAAFIFLNVLN